MLGPSHFSGFIGRKRTAALSFSLRTAALENHWQWRGAQYVTGMKLDRFGQLNLESRRVWKGRHVSRHVFGSYNQAFAHPSPKYQCRALKVAESSGFSTSYVGLKNRPIRHPGILVRQRECSAWERGQERESERDWLRTCCIGGSLRRR